MAVPPGTWVQLLTGSQHENQPTSVLAVSRGQYSHFHSLWQATGQG
jgi:hypothetical protein